MIYPDPRDPALDPVVEPYPIALDMTAKLDPIIFSHYASLITVSPLYDTCNYYFLENSKFWGPILLSKEHLYSC